MGPLQYNQSSPLQYTQPLPLQYIQPSPLQNNQLAQLEYKQTTPITCNTSNENSQQCIECDDKTKPPAIYQDYDSTAQVHDDKTKIIFKCTICNTDFKKKTSLMRHNRDFHDAFLSN